ncbi:MAG: hypothetical protein VKJ46_02705, partial [Leptolyngbyaceae bacterium]|nr:hypothetical protein [Leptolyngbyaceae bacterium]
FASTLAKSDLGKGETFSSYPLLQLLEEPSLPETPTAPKPTIVLIGALFGSIFSTTGLTLLWWRQRIQTYVKRRGRPG